MTGITLPVTEYSHDDGYCAVIGGAMHQGRFVHADMCTGQIRAVDRSGRVEILLETELAITSIGAGDDGTLYAADFATGAVYRLALDR